MSTLIQGFSSYMVEPNILSFSNHGCNGTYNVLDSGSFNKEINGRHLTEQNAELSDYPQSGPIYNPYLDRHIKALDYIEAIADINPNEEIFSDYIFFSSSSPAVFYKEAQHLKRICRGEEIGLISQNEGSDEKPETEIQ